NQATVTSIRTPGEYFNRESPPMFPSGSSRVAPARFRRRRGGFHRRRNLDGLRVTWLEERVLLSLTPSAAQSALPVSIGTPATGQVARGTPVYYRLSPGSDGLLLATAHAGSAQLRLSLYDGAGNLLVQSDGQSAAVPNPLINHHVTGSGTDYLEVESL